ncbi:hypothetical protein B566_EDAN009865 [Ephemera danica]|nr:hypothetical protein B566_EDAN009865 [Ephemera danica]
MIMDDRWESEVIEFGAVNITGFRIVDTSRKYVREFLDGWLKLEPAVVSSTVPGNPAAVLAKRDTISAQAALMYDAVFVLVEAFNKMLRKKPDLFRNNIRRGQIFNNGSRGLDCNTSKGWVTPWEHGDKISRFLRKAELDGLTGDIRFNDDGRRVNYTLHVMEMTVNSAMVKEEPYIMLRTPEPGENLTGNDRFEAPVTITRARERVLDFSEHFMDLGISIMIKKPAKQAPGVFSFMLPVGREVWAAMVGAYLAEADIAIASMTITSERERVIDFSKPFMSLGISIMIKKPVKQKPGVFSFLNPLSKEIWVCVIFSYVGVSIVLFTVSRFSPYEWRVEETLAGTTVSNDFSILNSLWFALGAFMQQGCDISPR